MNIIDLSHPLTPDMDVWPGDPRPSMTPAATRAGQGYLSQVLSLPSHAGTHLDAPAHVLDQGRGLEDLDLARCLGPARVLDVRDKSVISEADVARPLDGASFLLLRSDHCRFWGKAEYYRHFPRLSRGACQLLVASGLLGLGLDWPSPDGPESRELNAHRILLGAGLALVENLRGLDRLPESGFLFLALPLAVRGGDGTPVRACALTDLS